ncbi:hypothetical protein C172_25430 [Paenibacillus sp. FSL H8-457]|nr:hypothetical protein C172_25430 [Paenibacillus sp. FSL H8-457]
MGKQAFGLSVAVVAKTKESLQTTAQRLSARTAEPGASSGYQTAKHKKMVADRRSAPCVWDR